MRVHVVSDVHGNAEALERAGDGADALLVLGDLIDFVDYHDHGGGILGAVFGPEKVATFAKLRRERAHAEAAAFARSLWTSLPDPGPVVEEAIREQYARLFGALTVPTYATPGNVDVPALWPEFAGDAVRILDGEVAEIGGLRFGFVGGALLPPLMRASGDRGRAGGPPEESGLPAAGGESEASSGRSGPHPESDAAVVRRNRVFRPYLRTEADFADAVACLSDVDVVCSHIPPDVPELTYDVVARRAELGSAALSDLIRKQAPRWAVFGHVHQPLTARMRLAFTECANVGHFQRTGRPYVLRW